MDSPTSDTSNQVSEYKSDSPNISFYKNEIPAKPNEVCIEEILLKWAGNYHLLEKNHVYIQWLFPNRVPGLNIHSSVLTNEEAEIISSTAQLRDRVKRSFEMMLDFYGMRLLKNNQFELANNSRLEELNQTWNHNYLRITRILLALKELGHSDLMLPWLKFMANLIYKEKKLNKAQHSFENFWVHTLDSKDKEELAEYKNMLLDYRPADMPKYISPATTGNYNRNSPYAQSPSISLELEEKLSIPASSTDKFGISILEDVSNTTRDTEIITNTYNSLDTVSQSYPNISTANLPPISDIPKEIIAATTVDDATNFSDTIGRNTTDISTDEIPPQIPGITKDDNIINTSKISIQLDNLISWSKPPLITNTPEDNIPITASDDSTSSFHTIPRSTGTISSQISDTSKEAETVTRIDVGSIANHSTTSQIKTEDTNQVGYFSYENHSHLVSSFDPFT